MKSFRIALTFALIFSVVEVVRGHMHGSQVAEGQPVKLAAMEAHWETAEAAPLYLFVLPNPKDERNSAALGRIPGGFSMLAFHSPDATWFASSLTIVSATLFVVVGLYPALLPSSLDPVYSMTIHNSASSPMTLKIMLGVAPTFVPIVILYQAWGYNLFKEKVTGTETAYGDSY